MKIGILGSGGWGTALGCVLLQNNHSVTLWSRTRETASEINLHHTNSAYLPGVTLPSLLQCTTNFEEIAKSDMFVVAVPSQFIRQSFHEFGFDCRGKIVVNTSKGIERHTLLRISQLLHETGKVSPEYYVDLTGPSHAEEVSRSIPTTVVSAGFNSEVVEIVQKAFMTPRFRVYSSDDVIGAELGGALKNVIAIATGIVVGMGFGDNTVAALMTRGLAEITRLGVHLGAKPETFAGLSGIGDLMVTCMSKHSRNRRVGELIGKGKTLIEILGESKQVAEGVGTTDSARELANKCGVEMPIVEQMHQILFAGKRPIDAINDLMTRDMKTEW